MQSDWKCSYLRTTYIHVVHININTKDPTNVSTFDADFYFGINIVSSVIGYLDSLKHATFFCKNLKKTQYLFLYSTIELGAKMEIG